MTGTDCAALAAVAAARSGDWTQANAQAGQSPDPLALKMLRWLDYARARRRPGDLPRSPISSSKIPDWPQQKTLRRHAEEALAGESDDTAAAVAQAPPADQRRGQGAGGRNHDRTRARSGPAPRRCGRRGSRAVSRRPRSTTSWRGIPPRCARKTTRSGSTGCCGTATPMQRAACCRWFRPIIMPWRKRASRSPPTRPMPAAWWRRCRPSFARIRGSPSRRRAGRARRTITTRPPSCCSPITTTRFGRRRGWASGCWSPASCLTPAIRTWPTGWSSSPNSNAGNAYAEAEFLCGYIALRYRKDPALAFDHFAHMLARVTSPYAEARAAYWSGRAAAAAGKPDLAAKWYAAGAENMATFYGQLSAHQLGRDAPPHPVPEPRPTGAERARFNGQRTGPRGAAALRRRRPPARRHLCDADGACGEDAGRFCDAGRARPNRMPGSIWRSRWRTARSTRGCR